jgi:hypothetical protein
VTLLITDPLHRPLESSLMPAHRLARFILNVLLCSVGCVLLHTPSAIAQNAVELPQTDLTATDELAWRRGNMHTHSLWSDGDNYPEMIAAWYKEHGYQFLVFTDHNTLLKNERWVEIDKTKGGRNAFAALNAAFPNEWVTTRMREVEKGEEKKKENIEEVRLKTFDEIFSKLAVPQKYLLIQGEEITDKFKNKPIHMCATNTQELLPPTGGDSVVDVMQRNIDSAVSRRERTGVKTLVHLNHPNFGYAITAEQLMQVVGENFFEVYNGHPTVYNTGDATHASTERIWDIINTFRLSKLNLPVMFGLATDDGHNYFETQPGKGAQPGRGWVMVLTNKLDPDALVESLEAGQFYSSSGVTLESVTTHDGQMKVVAAPAEGVTYRIDFIGTRRSFNDQSLPASDDSVKADDLTRKYSDEIGMVLKSVDGPTAEYKFDGSELYVRAVVTSSRLHPNPSEAGEFERAWVQPIIPQK